MIQKLENNNIWRLIQCMIVSFTICIAFDLTTSNILYLLTGGLYCVVSRQRAGLIVREKWVNRILSFLFSAFMVLGNIENILAVDFLLAWPVTVVLCFYGFYLCFDLLLGHLLVYLRDVSVTNTGEERSGKQIAAAFFVSLLALLFVWGIGLLISYPGNTTRDSNGFINIALGNEDMRAAIPIVYVLAIRELWHWGMSLFGTANAALALCSTAHILLIALIVSYLISALYARGVKKSICIVVWLFFGIIPYNVQLSHTIWKDIPFSAFVFLFMILLCEQYFVGKSESKIKEICRLVLIVVAGIGMCLMRSNGYFAFLFFLPFGVCLFFKNNKSVLVAMAFALVLVKIIQGPVYDKIMTEHKIWMNELIADSESTEETETVEAPKIKEVKNATNSYNASGIYIITVQQLGRVAVDRTDLSTEDYQRLNNVIDVERMREEYDPYCRDSAGYLINYKLPMTEYVKEWLYFGFKYPIQYVLGWKDQTFGYWYPDIQYWVYTDQIKENDLGLYKDSILSDDQRYELMLTEELYKEIPVYGMLWSIGFVVWITLFFTGVTFIKKGIKAAMLYVPVLAVWATLLVATPVYAEFRYIYAIFLCLPLSILLPFIPDKKQQAVESE